MKIRKFKCKLKRKGNTWEDAKTKKNSCNNGSYIDIHTVSKYTKCILTH